MPDPLGSSGRVLHVNVSAGGVPKEAVREARVGSLGLKGDHHRANTVHGGPLRAVCLLGIEVIERLKAEGHPIFPGSVGENLTTVGIELSDLPAGTQLEIGEVLLEVTTPAMPCDTIVRSFRDGKSGRISILLHPHDSRMYARVLREGVVREGDAIHVLPADPDSNVAAEAALFRIESVLRFAHLGLWRAAAAGHAMEIVDDGELAVGSSPELQGSLFNQAIGLRSLPYYLPLVLERFRETGQSGWLDFPSAPWTGAVPDECLEIRIATPDRVDSDIAVAGVEVREARSDEHLAWANGPVGRPVGGPDAWPAVMERVAAAHNNIPFLAVADGRVVGTSLLVVHRRVGYLAATGVAPEARGRGIQRALIGARARRAIELGCDLLAVEVATDNGPSRANLERAGFRVLATREMYRFDPGGVGENAIAEARERYAEWMPHRLPGPLAVASRPG